MSRATAIATAQQERHDQTDALIRLAARKAAASAKPGRSMATIFPKLKQGDAP
jgi:hypothetical protein